MQLDFNSGEKLCGVGAIKVLPWYIPALKIKYALNALQPISGKVLDFGCGAGAMTRALAFYRQELKIIGCDINKKEIAAAQQINGQAEFVYGDIYNLPFSRNHFDGVVSFDVLEHLDNIGKAIKEVNRVLKPGGIFYFVMACEGDLSNIEGILSHFGWRVKKITCGHNPYSFKEVENLLFENRFSIFKRQFSGHIFQQIVDVCYFSMLALRGKDVSYQVEGYISSQTGVIRNIVMLIKNFLACLFYSESVFLSCIPGMHLHLTAIKENK
jgi:ubiquinone/menaquinone biosynthesis C-methylase UbiE